MKEKFYITSAIAYASAIPHIGNVYEVILADAIARFKRLDGHEVFFQTGTDEHGQKIETNAAKQELKPKAYVDMISSEIKRIYDLVGVSYDKFIRTTDSDHEKSVQAIFQKLYDQGDIYLGKYEGWYSVAEEAYISENDIVDGKGPNGDIPVWTSEDAYFLKLEKYQERLLKHIETHPDFIRPESRKNEMIQNFLKEPLPDLSISRTSFKWGIPVPFDPKHVIYVWIDALSNYITGIGYHPNEPKTELFNKLWPADIHLIGKDIARFHTIYWPILLMALELELPKQIFCHPWILFDKNKMSKSVGNVLYTDDLVKHFGVDVLRYYVLHEIPYAQDGNITYELLIERNNSDLANTIGNLVNRTIGMAKKYRDGHIKRVILKEPFELSLEEKALEVLPRMRTFIDSLKIGEALEEVVQLARYANKYIDVSEPWKLFKDENAQETLDHVLYHLVETIRYIAVLLKPFLPETAENILEQIKAEETTFTSLETFGVTKEKELGEAKVLFERFELDKKINHILED
ncbi:Methionyl-tRNA synthetase [Alteracholeplasma palmae J233]|uniref:Methionine--tRNA ligase n=1 Tax=Alteracholeplasma palmae (strain ATCC 49389 / J233) TaxID=1318466 RepID=U4KLN2_ALTPJ|nr:methionine--tRNA ligase [Alteracholeplasma palmae]CCV64884.1 Methionyl-tRNA synthetase [Alteracholeplasma palmae J233]